MNTNEYCFILEQLKKDLGNQLLPVGCIMMFPNERVPDGFMPCDGRELPIASYPELYAVIGHTFKPSEPSSLDLFKKGKTAKSTNASKTVFHLPDMRGLFVRGWDPERNVDSDTDRKFGGMQEDAFQGHAHKVLLTKALRTDSGGSHRHKVYYKSHDVSSGMFSTYPVYEVSYNTTNETFSSDGSGTTYEGSHAHEIEIPDGFIQIREPEASIFGIPKFETETRPKNIALMFCIKVK